MITKFANPRKFLKVVDTVMPIAAIVSAVSFGIGLYLAFFASPEDYQQGDTVRIMYIHVPAAMLALGVYTSMAVAAFVGLVWRHVVAELYPRAAAPLGAAFTLICLVTGSLWGKPMWGTWWVWDARLTSVLILFFLYLGYMALSSAFDDEQKNINSGAVLLLVGVINIPVIKFSVDWWNTLHQPASIMRLAKPAIDTAMLKPLGVMALGFIAFFIAVVCLRLKTEIEKRKQLVKSYGA